MSAGIVRVVKLSKLMVLTMVATIAGGCQSTSPRYTKLRVTNYRGELVADWIAEGRVRKLEKGYQIKAVERTSGPPRSQTTRYPNGWRTFVNGPHIVRWPCGKPFWLYQIDGH